MSADLHEGTLQHLRGLLDAAGEVGAVAVVDDLLLLAEVAAERAAAAVEVEPQGRQSKVYTARDLQKTLHMAWREVYSNAPKGPEGLTSEARRRAFLLGAWGVTSTRDFTDEHANGARGVQWLAGLARYPKALNFAVEDYQRIALEQPTAAELEEA